MRRILLQSGLLTGLIALVACGGALNGDTPAAAACAQIMQDLDSADLKEKMTRECEEFYTHHASDEQKKQAQCIASNGLAACPARDFGATSAEAPGAEAGEGAHAKGSKVVLGTPSDLNYQPAPNGSMRHIGQQKVPGVLGALRDAGRPNGFGGAIDPQLGVEALIGAKGTQIGSGGLGSRGSRLSHGRAEGLGGPGTKKKTVHRPGVQVAAGNPLIAGALDRSEIVKVVKRHMSQIRYCYEKELKLAPKLKGKLTVKFVIAKDGSVSSSSLKSSTMKNAAVDSCVPKRFKRMRFPKPKGGGIVIVSYPFLLNPG